MIIPFFTNHLEYKLRILDLEIAEFSISPYKLVLNSHSHWLSIQLFYHSDTIASCLPLGINGPLVIHVRPNVGERPDDQDDLSYLFDVWHDTVQG